MKFTKVIKSKIVQVGGKYQVQSEKGRNLGTYDTKAEAEKRLKQVEMFKHMDKKASILTYANVFKPFIDDLTDNSLDWDIEDIDDAYIYINLYDSDHKSVVLKLDFRLDGYRPAQATGNKWTAPSDLDYYGHAAYFEDFFIDKITVVKIGDQKVSIDIPVDSPFGVALYEAVEETYKTEMEDYFPD